MAHRSVGVVAHLWRFPVKSMLGEKLDEAAVTQRGLVGDRGYALVETGTGKVVSAKNVKAYPAMFACRAAYVTPPRLGEPLPPVRITFPDGTSVTSDSRECDAALSKFFERDVKLAAVAPDDFTIDEYHPDTEKDDLGPAIEAKLGSALFARVGVPSPVPVGAFFDAFPLSVLTTSTLERLNALRPQSRFDERRFRMNVIVHRPHLKPCDVAAHAVHQFRPLHAIGVTGPVVDVGCGRQLAADLDAGNHQRVQIRPRGIQRGGVAGRAGPENHEPMMHCVCHVPFDRAARAPAADMTSANGLP